MKTVKDAPDWVKRLCNVAYGDIVSNAQAEVKNPILLGLITAYSPWGVRCTNDDDEIEFFFTLRVAAANAGVENSFIIHKVECEAADDQKLRELISVRMENCVHALFEKALAAAAKGE